jgi:hypothetical protein
VDSDPFVQEELLAHWLKRHDLDVAVLVMEAVSDLAGSAAPSTQGGSFGSATLPSSRLVG